MRPDCGNITSSECPIERPDFGSSCSLTQNSKCTYGEECCCGQCHPSIMMDCTGGRWVGFYTNVCLQPICRNTTSSECPVERPDFGSTCSLPNNVQCTYGEECCCGQCHPSMVMECRGGSWVGFYNDTCLRPNCGNVTSGCPELCP